MRDEYLITLIVFFLLIAIIYMFLAIFILTKLRNILKNNKNYVGKLFYLFKILLCLTRFLTSFLILK